MKVKKFLSAEGNSKIYNKNTADLYCFAVFLFARIQFIVNAINKLRLPVPICTEMTQSSDVQGNIIKVMKPVLYFTIPVFHLLINPLNYDILKSEKTNFTARFYTSLFLVYTKKYYIKIFFKASDFREIPVSISERRKNIG